MNREIYLRFLIRVKVKMKTNKTLVSIMFGHKKLIMNKT